MFGMTGRIMVMVLLVFGFLFSVTYPAFGAAGSTAICTWKGNRQAAYSFTIDDFPFSNIGNVPYVLPITIPLGIPLSWYVVTSSMFDPDLPHNGWDCTWDNQWITDLVQAGHELGSHTVNHPDNPTFTPTDSSIRVELRDSKANIEKMCPANGKCLTIAYSSSWGSCPIFTMAKEYYISGRGVNGPYNLKSPSLAPCAGNGAMFLLCKATLDPLDPCLADSGWFSDFIHGIKDNSSVDMSVADFTARMNDVYSRRAVLWAATQRDITQYVYERNGSTVQLVSASSSQIVLNLTHSLDTTLCSFTYPITLRTELDAAWNTVMATQGGVTTTANVITMSGKKYAVFDARPNQGQITLIDAGNLVAQPTVTPNGGTFVNSVSVTLSSPTNGTTIYYTTNGTDPTTSSTQYASAFNVTASATVKALAVKNGMTNSNITNVPITIAAASPAISPNGGTFSNSASVTLSTTTSGATMYYTTNGIDPTTSSTQYTGAFSVVSNSQVKAIAVKSGMANSSVASAIFTKYTAANIVYQINCGGNAAAPFTADAFFNSGQGGTSSATISTAGVTNPAPQAVYQSQRGGFPYNGFSYTFTGLATGLLYTVRLHFAEIYSSTDGGHTFYVSINGQRVLDHFDVFAAAGGANKALVKEFQANADASGKMLIYFPTDTSACSGIEILNSSIPVAINDRTWKGPVSAAMGTCPNPITRADLIKMTQQRGLKIYNLSGAPVEVGRIKDNGLYLVRTEGQTFRKIIVIK
jgi:peptidoglycan/xylan/chitin deacetylase (PgdA/CDA1 family)